MSFIDFFEKSSSLRTVVLTDSHFCMVSAESM